MVIRASIALLTLVLVAVSCGNGVVDSAGSAGGSVTYKTLHSSWISLTALMLYSKFDEAGATNSVSISDSSSSGLLGTLITSDGALKTTAGKVGNAFSLDGVDDYVTYSDPGASSALDAGPGVSITISAWINPSALPISGLQILTKGGTAASDNVNYSFQTSDGAGANGPFLSFSFFDGASWSVYHTSANALSTGVWQHVAVTFTFGGSTAVLYVNGAAVAGAWTGTATNVPVQSNEALWIGGSNAPAGAAVDSPFIGKIDEVSFWKRLLTPAEINLIYQRQLQ